MRPELPPAYGGCKCHCHRLPNVRHVRPCCRSPVQAEREAEAVQKEHDLADMRAALTEILSIASDLYGDFGEDKTVADRVERIMNIAGQWAL